jgi:hypothetical protein
LLSNLVSSEPIVVLCEYYFGVYALDCDATTPEAFQSVHVVPLVHGNPRQKLAAVLAETASRLANKTEISQ